MSEPNTSDYHIRFSGALAADADAVKVRTRLGKLYKISVDEVESRFFCGQSITLKKSDNSLSAAKYAKSFEKIGLCVDVVDMAKQRSEQIAPPPVPKPSSKPSEGKVTDTKQPPTPESVESLSDERTVLLVPEKFASDTVTPANQSTIGGVEATPGSVPQPSAKNASEPKHKTKAAPLKPVVSEVEDDVASQKSDNDAEVDTDSADDTIFEEGAFDDEFDNEISGLNLHQYDEETAGVFSIPKINLDEYFDDDDEFSDLIDIDDSLIDQTEIYLRDAKSEYGRIVKKPAEEPEDTTPTLESTKYGAVLVSPNGEKRTSSRRESVPDEHTNSNKNKRSSLKTWMYAAAVLLGIGLAGSISLVDFDSVDISVPREVLAAENALADSNLKLISYVNVATLSALANSARTENTNFPASLLPLGPNSIFLELQKSGLDVVKSVDYAVYGASVNPSNKAHSGLILLGQFNYTSIRNYLRQHYQVEESDGNASIFHVHTVNPDNCKRSDSFAIQITPSRVVISSPENIGTLLNRLDTGAPANFDLTEWQQHQSKQLMSVGLFSPKSLNFLSEKQQYAPLFSKLSEVLSGASNVFIGYEVSNNPFIRSSELVVDIEAANAAWVAEMEPSLLRIFNGDIAMKLDSIPALHTLYEGLETNSVDNLLKISSPVSLENLPRLVQLPVELDWLGFVDREINQHDTVVYHNKARSAQEAIFHQFYSHGDLKEFKSFEGDKPDVSTTKGPFGFGVKSLKFDAESGRTELNVFAVSTDIHNIGMTHNRVKFMVSDITSNSGESLLSHQSCDLERNSSYATFYPSKNGELLIAEKTLYLNKGVKVSDIAAIRGHAKLALPTHTINKKISSNSQAINRDGVSLKIEVGENGSLNYHINGDVNKLLSLRAQTSQSRYLKETSRTATPLLFGGESRTVKFQGKVFAIEFVFENQSSEKKYVFVIDSPIPIASNADLSEFEGVKPFSSSPEKQPFKNGKPAESKTISMVRSSAETGGFSVELESLQIADNLLLTSQLHIASNKIGKIANNLNGAELLIKGIETERGYIPLKYRTFFSLTEEGAGSTIKKAKIDIDAALKKDPGEIYSIDGIIVLRRPKQVDNFSIHGLEPGVVYKHNNLTAMVEEISQNKITLAFNDAGERVLAVRSLDEEGQGLDTSSTQLLKQKQGWKYSTNFNAETQDVVISVAKEQGSADYPFSLKVSPSETSLLERYFD